MFKYKELVKLQDINDTLIEQKTVLQFEKNQLEKNQNEVVEMIENFNFFNDNVFSLLRKIKNKLKD